MNRVRLGELAAFYQRTLRDDVMPFWMKHGVDRECGGFLTALDRDGAILDTDKSVWFQGRAAWMYATLHNRLERRREWLDLARHGIDFLRAYCFDSDGRMFFQVTREGLPLRKRRYAFSECFSIIALAAYAQAAGETSAASEARLLFRELRRLTTTPGLLEPKVNSRTRPMKGIGLPMITLNVAQELRDTIGDDLCEQVIDECISDIRQTFIKPELRAVMEVVAPDGSILDHFDGRTLNPGHAIEAAWFILREAHHRNNDPGLIATGCTMLDWMWERGWDSECGGIYYFRDVYNKPVQEYWHDMKFWWPHAEAIIATLMAYHLTGDAKYARWHQMVHDWSFAHFPDPEHGEWFGYPRRDGSVSVPLKGNMWKGPFHLPRMLLICSELCDEMLRS